jgi:trimethylamine--corrinoid protein Co-methyltransferase
MRAETLFLSEPEIARIHQASLDILNNTGVRVLSETARALLSRNGARCQGLLVKIPPDLVRCALDAVKEGVTLAAREEGHSLCVPGEFPCVAPSGYCAFVVDHRTGEKRHSTSMDLREFAVVCDALDCVDLFWPSVFPTDLPPEMEEIHALAIALRNTGKHVQCSCRSVENARWLIRLAECVKTGRHWPFSAVVAPVSPLTFEEGTCDAMIALASKGVPVVPMTMALAATTAPATMAGTIALANAEELAALAIVKCANPKAPMIYASEAAPSHKRTGNINYDAPEYPLFSAACGQMARHYGMPSMTSDVALETLPADTLSFERNVLRVAMGFMARPDLSAWLGSVEQALSVSLIQIVLDAEASLHARAYLRTFDTSDTSLALDIIDEVGPGGCFLGKVHTARHFRKEMWTRDMTETFLLEPGSSFEERARDTIQGILASHQPTPVDQAAGDEMERLLGRAAQEIAGA